MFLSDPDMPSRVLKAELLGAFGHLSASGEGTLFTLFLKVVFFLIIVSFFCRAPCRTSDPQTLPWEDSPAFLLGSPVRKDRQCPGGGAAPFPGALSGAGHVWAGPLASPPGTEAPGLPWRLHLRGACPPGSGRPTCGLVRLLPRPGAAPSSSVVSPCQPPTGRTCKAAPSSQGLPPCLLWSGRGPARGALSPGPAPRPSLASQWLSLTVCWSPPALAAHPERLWVASLGSGTGLP